MHSAVAVANELFKNHKRKRIGIIPLRRLMKYIHICDIMAYSMYKRRLVEDLTMYCRFGPLYESLMREMEELGNRDMPCELTLPRYNIEGEYIGRYIPSIKEKLFLELIEMVYDVFSQQTDQELMDFVLLPNLPVALAEKDNAIYVKRKYIEQSIKLIEDANQNKEVTLTLIK